MSLTVAAQIGAAICQSEPRPSGSVLLGPHRPLYRSESTSCGQLASPTVEDEPNGRGSDRGRYLPIRAATVRERSSCPSPPAVLLPHRRIGQHLNKQPADYRPRLKPLLLRRLRVVPIGQRHAAG